MSDAEYMMNNYTEAQNQGMWEEDYTPQPKIDWEQYTDEELKTIVDAHGLWMFRGYARENMISSLSANVG